MNIKLVIGSQS